MGLGPESGVPSPDSRPRVPDPEIPKLYEAGQGSLLAKDVPNAESLILSRFVHLPGFEKMGDLTQWVI